MRYYVPCDCYYTSKFEIKICDDVCCNEKKYPEIKRMHMCKIHTSLLQGKNVRTYIDYS